MNTATKFELDAIEKPKMMKIKNADKSLFSGSADDSDSDAAYDKKQLEDYLMPLL